MREFRRKLKEEEMEEKEKKRSSPIPPTWNWRLELPHSRHNRSQDLVSDVGEAHPCD